MMGIECPSATVMEIEYEMAFGFEMVTILHLQAAKRVECR